MDIVRLDTENNVQRRKMMDARLASILFLVQLVPLSFRSLTLLKFITEYISYSDHFKETK